MSEHDDDSEGAAALSRRAEELDQQGGRGPADALARVEAHLEAASASEGAVQDRHFKGMFRALIRVAELEGTLPELEGRVPGGGALRAALEAHRSWRQGAASTAAAEGYRVAFEAEVPQAVRPYLLFWYAHLLGVEGRLELAIEKFRELLDLGPPGSGGRRDVEARIRHLEEKLASRSSEQALAKAEALRSDGQPEAAVELLEQALEQDPEPGRERALRTALARILTVMGEKDRAREQWARLRGPSPSESNHELGEPADAEPEAPRGEVPGDPGDPPAGGQDPGGALVAVGGAERDALLQRARHQAELARRLDEAGQAREAALALRRSYQCLPRGAEQDRVRRRAAAQAWHRAADPVLAMEALAGLAAESRKAPDVARLEQDMGERVMERLRRDVDLGLRAAAFEALSDLYRSLDEEEPLREQLLELHLERLSSCVYRRWRLRREEVSAELAGFRGRGMGAWDLVRLPSEAAGSPQHLAALDQESEILEIMGRSLQEKERRVLDSGDLEGQARRLEDPEGVLAMEALLDFVREVARRRSNREDESPMTEWRDRLVSWLPQGARALLLSRGGLSVDSALADLVGQFEAFLELRYSR